MNDRWILRVGLAMWAIAAVVAWIAQPPLGHDESQYAIAAADLLASRPQRWLYVSQGTALVGVPGNLAGGSELAIRFAPMLLSLGFVLAASRLARTFTTSVTAAWLVCVLAASFGIVRRATELLSDMPAAAALLLGTAILVDEVTRTDGPRRRVVLVAPAFAAAFYFRYGSALPIAVVGVVCAIGGWRGVVRGPARIAATLALFAILLVPHLIIAHRTTGSPLGLLTLSTQTIAERTTSSGLAGYLTANPLRWYGVVTTPLLVIGVVSVARLRERRLVMLWVIAVATTVMLGLTALAQARYLFFPLVVFLVLGIELVRRHAGTLVAIALAAIVAASWALALAWIVPREDPTLAFVKAAAAKIEPPCRIYASVTQAQWYARQCAVTYQILPEHLAEARNYVIITPKIDPAAFPGTPVVVHEDGPLTLLRLDP